jgi:flagellar biosynthesis anti-sigma factor FlgM
LQRKTQSEEVNVTIDSNQSGQTVSESKGSAARSQTASSPTGGGLSASEDQARLSGTHMLVRVLAAEAAQLRAVREDVRQEKVSALRQAVQRGDYRPNPEQVADALFSHLGANGLEAPGEGDCRADQEWATAI